LGTSARSSEQDSKRVIAVLGMHRSGTSAATRGLRCLGVELGDQLLQGEEGQNPRGFFEDEPLLEISDRVFEVLGISWDSMRLIAPIEWKRPEIDRLRIEAAESIERRFESVPIWGFKNPRSARLLPFWRSVFPLVDRSDSYVIMLRNPLSVARSLQARNGFSARRSFMLWLVHQVQAVTHTKGKPRVCVDFDLMLEDPEAQLQRVAEALNLPPASQASIEAYAHDFLSSSLRHSRFDDEDVQIEPELSELGRRAYEILQGWASGENEAPSKIDRAMRQIEKRLLELSPFFTEFDDLQAQIFGERDAHGAIAREWQNERQGLLDRAEDRSANEASLEREITRMAENGAARETSLEREIARMAENRAARETSLEREIAGMAEGHSAKETSLEREIARMAEGHSAKEASLEREITRMAETLGVSNAASIAQQSALASAEKRTSTLENTVADIERSRHDLEESYASLDEEKGQLLQEMERLRSLLGTRERDIEALSEQIEVDRRNAQGQLNESLSRLSEVEQRHTETVAELDDIRMLRNTDVARLTAQIDLETGRVRDLENRTHELGRERQHFETELENRDRLSLEKIESGEISSRDLDAWVVAQVPTVAASIQVQAEAMSETRTWRTARKLQRLVDRFRLRSSHDGLQHVIHLAQLLEAQSIAATPNVRDLAPAAETLSKAIHQVLRGEIVASLQMTARSGRRLIGRPVVNGPAERLFDEATEIAYFLNQLSGSPFASPASRVGPAIPRAELTEAPTLVDVVVPVYGARAETQRCLESLLRTKNSVQHEIVVIDDGNHDSKLVKILDEHASQGRITLLKNSRNLGFPHAANRGMTLHPDRDVVLLNSDTRVSDHWLDRLRQAARSDWKIATATPFSNDGEICSWPLRIPPAPAPDDQELDRLNSLLVGANPGRSLTIPTAVGFCMYITREAIRDVGLFDAECFGRGYGEESDFCMRAKSIGYRNILAADVYVAHEGSRSFGSEKEERRQHASKMISLRHPQYAADVERFIAADPAKPLRRLISARISFDSSRPNILMISHARGGGTQRHIEEMSQALDNEGIGTLFLHPTADGSVRLAREIGPPTSNDDDDEMVFKLESEMASLVETLRATNVRHIHIHHILDNSAIVTSLPGLLRLPFDVTLHDYYGICPRVHLADGLNRYCGEPAGAQCNTCVKQYGSELGRDVDVERWRTSNDRWLGSARRIFVPSADTAERFSRYFPDLTFTLRPHPTARSTQTKPRKRKGSGKMRRVAVLGAINSHKGSGTLVAAIRDAEERRLPLRFEIIGYTDRDDELENSPRATVSGPYDPENLPRLLEQSRCEMAFLPSPIPETFSYALSEAVLAGLFPVAFALGAQAQRIRDSGWGHLLSLDLEAAEINDALLALKIPEPSDAASQSVHYESMLRDYYDALEFSEPVHST